MTRLRAYEKMCERFLTLPEDQMRLRIKDFLIESGISYIDLIPVLTDCFNKGQQPFFEDADGHFNSIGQEAVAEAVYRYIVEAETKGLTDPKRSTVN